MTILDNFSKTLSALELFSSTPIVDNRDRTGIIQAFEFTFEQSWKAIQKMAHQLGASVASPKTAFIFAMQNYWIDPKQVAVWLELLRDRNLTSQTYQEELASEVLERIQTQYIILFKSLLNNLHQAINSNK